MAILTNIVSTQDNTHICADAYIAVKEFLKTAGWIVVGSAQSTSDPSGGMHYDGGATDRIGTDPDNFNTLSQSWFVMESPHADVADRIQILFRLGTQTYVGYCDWTPTAQPGDRFEGAGAAIPTSPYQLQLLNNSGFEFNGSARYHMVADDAGDYGFGILGTRQRDARTSTFSMALLPLINTPANAGKPYAFTVCNLNVNNFLFDRFYQDDGVETGTFSAEPMFPPQTPIQATCPTYNSESFRIVPRDIDYLDDGYTEPTFPLIFMNYRGQYFGTCEFVRWNGIFRERLQTFDDGEGGTRINFGDVTFPWDDTPVIV